MSTAFKLSFYLKESLQLRPMAARLPLLGFLGSCVASLVVFFILLFGRPAENYWEKYSDANSSLCVDDPEAIPDYNLGTTFALDICETPDCLEFARFKANSFAAILPLFLAFFLIILSLGDFRDSNQLQNSASDQPASILLKFPLWSFYFGLNLIFLAFARFFYFSTVLTVPLSIYALASWAIILAIVLCAVARLLDPPVREKVKSRTLVSNVLNLALIVGHFSFFLVLLLRIDPEEDNYIDLIADEETDNSGLYNGLFLLLCFLGTLSAVVHWRAHSLSIDQQPALMFAVGILIVIYSVLDSYDTADSDLCTDGFFQIRAFAYIFYVAAILTTVLFFRADKWKERGQRNRTQKLLVVPRKNQSLPRQPAPTQGALPPNGPEQDSPGTNDIAPENLGPNPTSPSRLGANAFSARVGNHSFSNFLSASQRVGDQIGNQLRRATSEFASNRYATPELGFTPGQIRFAEIAIGLVVSTFILAVVYIAFD